MMVQLSEYMDSLENKVVVMDAECDLLRAETEEVKSDRDQLELHIKELLHENTILKEQAKADEGELDILRSMSNETVSQTYIISKQI